MNDPWFRWSWLMGIKPIHPRGQLITGLYLLVAAPLIFFSIQTIEAAPIISAIMGVAFVVASLVFWWMVFWNMKGRD